MNRNQRRPNDLLRHERDLRGWSQRRLAEEVGTTEGIVSRWERGERTPEPYYREKLCALFGKNAEELGFLSASQRLYRYNTRRGVDLTHQATNADIQRNKRGIMQSMTDNNTVQDSFLVEESDSCFSFGRLKTTWTVLDGDGIAEYTPDTLHCHYSDTPEKMAPEIEEEKEQIAQVQAQNKAEGKLFQWNGQKYNLFKILISREPEEENMTLDLWFRPTDYYTSLATYKMLDNLDFRKKYFPEEDWLFPSPHFVNSIGTNLTVLTSDDHVILTQRSATQGVRPQMFSNSVSEGASRPQDRGPVSLAPDLYRCASRGLFEELGLRQGYDFVSDNILFLCFGTDTQYGLYGPRGMVRVQATSSEVLKSWNNGVKDKVESKKLLSLPFNPRDIASFVFSHDPWFPGALPGLYFTLVHEFGREEVDRVLSSH